MWRREISEKLWAQWHYQIQFSNVKDVLKTVIQKSVFLVTRDVVQYTQAQTHSLARLTEADDDEIIIYDNLINKRIFINSYIISCLVNVSGRCYVFHQEVIRQMHKSSTSSASVNLARLWVFAWIY